MYVAREFPLILAEWIESEQSDRPDLARRARALATRGSPPLEKWASLVDEVCGLAAQPAIGLQIGATVRLEHAGPLGHILVCSRTFGELLDTYVVLEKWFYGQTWVTRRDMGSHIELCWQPRMDISRYVEQLHMAALLTVFRMACPQGARLVAASMTAPARHERQAYERFFDCPVHFAQPRLVLRFSAEAVSAPVDSTVPSLRVASSARRRVLAGSHVPESTFVRLVKEAILRRLPERSASVNRIAVDLCLSARTFQRRLAQDGLSFRLLVAGLRQRRAEILLRQTSLSVQEVAFLVGYSEHSTFTHAYRQWTGSTPRRRRSDQLGAKSQVLKNR